MRAGARLGWRVATAVAFGATAALAVTLSRGAPSSAALTSAKANGAPHATVVPSQPAAFPRCTASGLRISVGPGARVTTVVTRYALGFTNVSDAPCTLGGYPQVSAYQGDDKQVGDAAARDASGPVGRILLNPGQTAYASLDASLSRGRCRPVHASGLRVVFPGQSAARYVRRPLTACATQVPQSQDYLSVRAIQSGAGSGAGSGAASKPAAPA